MKLLLVANIFCISFLIEFSAQNLSLSKAGTLYSICFKTLLWSDDSRKFKFKNQANAAARPIRAFAWYPAAKTKKQTS